MYTLELIINTNWKNYINTLFFFGEGESVWPCIGAVRAYFCHMRDLKQREKDSSDYVVSSIAEICVLVNPNECIYLS